MTVGEMLIEIEYLLAKEYISKEDKVSIFYDNGFTDTVKEVDYFIEPTGLVIKS